MKPVKSLLFLLGLLFVAIAADFLLELNGYKGFLAGQRTGHSPDTAMPRIFPESDSDARPDEKTRQWQTRLRQDSEMQLYTQIYRNKGWTGIRPELQSLPLVPLEYDTAGAGRFLLQHFLSKLLVLRNPEQSELLTQWYQRPSFWTEELAENRPKFARILCYGDKQQDTLASHRLRHYFQQDFGGAGPGRIPVTAFNGEGSGGIRIEYQGNWHQVSASNANRKGNYGIATSYLAPPPLNALTGKVSQGDIIIRIPGRLSACTGPLFLELIVHEGTRLRDLAIEADNQPLSLSASLSAPGQKRLTYAIPPSCRQIRIGMELNRNCNLYSLSLNDTSGLCVDNLYLPRSHGRVFSVNNRRFLTDQMNLSNTALVLYRFGSSLLPETDAGQDVESKYEGFRLRMLHELSYIRSLMPDLPVVVFGIADKDAEERGLDPAAIRQIQKEAAWQTACIYWNGQKAFPPDMTSLEEADLDAKLFYKALSEEYREFLAKEHRNAALRRAKELQSEKKH